MSKNSFVIGVDVGGSHILSGAVELRSGTLIKDSLFEQKIDNKATRELILSDWSRTINKTLACIPNESVVGIGFAMPGAFNYKTGLALFEGNEKYEALYDCDVPGSLGPLLTSGDLDMRFLNDATSFAVGEAWQGAAAGKSKAISITLGTGFGSAFVHDGIPVTTGDTVPEHGCLWHLPFLEGIGDDYFSTRWFVNRYKDLTGQTISGAKDVHDLAVNGDPKAAGMFQEFGRHMASFIAPWVRKFHPEVLVMGGNISRAWDLVADPFHRQLKQEGLALEVRVSTLKEHAALLGSARLFDEESWPHIQAVLTEF